MDRVKGMIKSIIRVLLIAICLCFFSCSDYSAQGLFKAIRANDVWEVEKICRRVSVDRCLLNNELSPLMYALAIHSFDSADFLISRTSNFNVQDTHGWNALLYAIKAGNGRLVKAIIDEGADPNYVNEKQEMHTLFYAVDRNDTTIVKILMEGGANIDAHMKSGVTPLSHAIGFGKNEVAKILLKNGANFDIKDKNNHSAIDFALNYNNNELFELIVDHYMEDVTPDWFVKLCREGQFEAVSFLVERERVSFDLVEQGFAFVEDVELAAFLLDSGADVDFREKNSGLSALHRACIRGDLPMIELLYKRGADLNLLNLNETYSPLMFAVIYSEDKPAVFNALGKYGLKEFAARELQGRVMVDVRKSRLESTLISKRLVEWGADIQFENPDKVNALGLAYEFRNHGLADYFETVITRNDISQRE